MVSAAAHRGPGLLQLQHHETRPYNIGQGRIAIYYIHAFAEFAHHHLNEAPQ